MPVTFPGEIPGDFTTTATISNSVNDTYASALEANNDSDWWQISLTAGFTYDFTLSEMPQGTGRIGILSGLGQSLVSSGEGGTVSITPSSSGTYYISVTDYISNFAPDGPYLFATRVDDREANDQSTTASIAGTGTTFGRLGQSLDSDWFRVTLTEGMSYGFGLFADTSSDRLRDGLIAVRSADGTVLTREVELRTASWTAIATGTYYVSVTDDAAFNNRAEGGYSIVSAMSDHVRNDARTTAGMIDGQRITGRVDVHGDADWYGFNAVSGRTYTLRLTGNGATDDLQYKTVRAFDSSGRQIDHDTDTRDGGVAEITFTASASGRIWFAAGTSTYEQLNTRETGGFFLQVISDAVAVNGTGANEHLTGGEVDNRISGQGGNDSVYGAGGDDLVMGGSGNDLVDGGEGNDSLRGEAGNDTFSGGAGIDTADFTGARAVRIDLSRSGAQNTGHGNDTFVSIENVQGSSANDAITGNGGANLLIGGAGNDSLRGGGGADSLQGDAGNDLLIGGAGKDWLIFTGGRAVTVNLSQSRAQTTGHGTDTIREVENILGAGGRDRLTGNGGANVLDGGANNDRLAGGGGNDRLIGGKGKDQLSGGRGRDVLNGGEGNDVLSGGAGADRFEFTRGMDTDRVTDFRNNTDELALSGFGFYSVRQVLDLATERRGDVHIDLGSGDTIIVRNMTIDALADDIVLI